MEIILHLGAHRTATTSFQHYMRANATKLATPGGMGFWGPDITRDGILTGVIPVPGGESAMRQMDRARGRIALRLAQARKVGLHRILVSDENMIGAARRNLRQGQLYDAAGERMARFAHAFDGRISRAVLSIRGQDAWWSSALAYGVARGHRLPKPDDLDRLVTVNRHWREVIRDIACALPGVDLVVLPHEIHGSRPEERLRHMTGLDETPRRAARVWLNHAPDLAALRRAVAARGGDAGLLPEGEGRWQPFDAYQKQALQEAYADDLFWLTAGADGLARLIEETGPNEAGTHPPDGHTTRGQDNGIEERRLA
ncbi:hypothetical protein [uncultured Roseovarius sp.]|uniref:hypothetical protein n=1 Tax=uncultured Roseovarius sp. TaxID=293344 RepID=UPI002621AE7B|nr:hypothetical protein [uncultured Roseovarius sp.]